MKNYIPYFFLSLLFCSSFYTACSPVMVIKYYRIIEGQLVYGQKVGDQGFAEINKLDAHITSFRPLLKNKQNQFKSKDDSWLDGVFVFGGDHHYFTDGHDIFYKGQPLKNGNNKKPVDASTFTAFPKMPAKLAVDKNYIYYDGVAVEDNTGTKKIDIATLKMVNEHLISDKNSLYHNGKLVGQNKLVKEIGVRSVLSDETTCAVVVYENLTSSIDNVFLNGIPLNADPETFTVKRWIVGVILTYEDKNGTHHYPSIKSTDESKLINYYFLRDGFYQNYDHVSVSDPYGNNQSVLEGADPEKIKIYNRHIAYDEEVIFNIISNEANQTVEINRIKISGKLVVLESGFAKDDQQVYLFTSKKIHILPNINAGKLQKLQTGVFTDGQNMISYDQFRETEDQFQWFKNADSTSFRQLNEHFAVDKNRVYLLSNQEFEVVEDQNAHLANLKIENKLLQTQNGFYLYEDFRFYHLPTVGQAKLLKFNYISDAEKVCQLLNYGFREIKSAEPGSFLPLSTNYSRDLNKVFYQENQIVNADATSFQPLEFNFAQDKNDIFQEGRVLEGADKKTFQVLSYKYSKDKNKVYRYIEILEDADAATFQLIDDEFAKDSKNIFNYGDVMKNVDYSSFKVLQGDLAMDKKRVYHGDGTLSLDRKSFMWLGCNYGKDKKNVYWLSENGFEKIEDADPKTFSLFGCVEGESYAEDGFNYFRNNNTISENEKNQNFPAK